MRELPYIELRTLNTTFSSQTKNTRVFTKCCPSSLSIRARTLRRRAELLSWVGRRRELRGPSWRLRGLRHPGRARPDQAQHSLLLPLHSFGGLRLQFAELFAVPEDDVHVFVKGFELTNERPGVLQDDSHPVVDVTLHLVILPHNHPVGFSFFLL